MEWFPERAYFVMPPEAKCKAHSREGVVLFLFFSCYGLAGLDSKKKKTSLSPLQILSATVRVQTQQSHCLHILTLEIKQL